MKILFYDAMQDSDAPDTLKSPSLKDTYLFDSGPLSVEFSKPAAIDCVGIANCLPGAKITITAQRNKYAIIGGNAETQAFETALLGGDAGLTFDDITIGDSEFDTFEITFTEDGLYLFDKNPFTYQALTIEAPDVTVGRLALGRAVDVPTSVAKEPGYRSTAAPQSTLSGQVIAGAGGYAYRAVSLESRYKIGPEAMEEIASGYRAIGAGYPFFIDLSTESYKLPFDKLYATEKSQQAMIFAGGINRFLYSKRWDFEEAF